jgi:ribosomal protein S12 methylthiotransferase
MTTGKKLKNSTSGRIGPRITKSAASPDALAAAGDAPAGPPPARVAFVTLGCPKNQVDSEVMLGRLNQAGFTTTSRLEDADVAVVNTCAFLEAAVSEGIDTILKVSGLKRENLKGLIVTGCMPQRYSSQILKEIPEVDAIVGTGEVDQIVEVCRNVLESKNVHRSFVGDANNSYSDPSIRVLSTPRHSPYLQISQGCSNTCTFCIIPTLRGPGRSRGLDDVFGEARRLVQSGARELVVIGQDTTAYGLDTDGRPRLGELLGRLDALEGDGLRWVRLMYTNPLFWDEALVEDFARSKTACHYVDMPIQHSVTPLLDRMGRGYTREHCRWLVQRLRDAVPDVALRTTMIVGFPGESEADFEAGLEFLEESRFDRLVAFPYFPEDGTAAFRLPDRVPDSVQKTRLKRLLDLQARISREKNRERVGGILDVLVDKPARGASPAEGRSHREAPEVDGVIRLTGADLLPGRFVKARITTANAFDLAGAVLPDKTGVVHATHV